MKYLYRVYQLFIAFPLFLVATILTAAFTTIGCILGNGHVWGYYPGMIWSKVSIRLFLLPVKVSGRENLKKGQSYVFVANHQGMFDIFLIYGYIHRNFKWMMKYQLRKMPFVGIACQYSHQIFVDKRGPSKIKASCDKARETLKDGMSLVVFPEGARTFTGHIAKFKRCAFMLADEIQLPVVPLSINGSFNVMPRTRDFHWIKWHPLTLTIHEPIYPRCKGAENIKNMETESYKAVMSGLVPEYQGFEENPDQ